VRVYADGSALVRYLPEPAQSVDWQRWAERHQPDLLVTSLSLAELRHAAAWTPAHVRARLHTVTERLEVARWSDQAVRVAALADESLSPFSRLHLGLAVAHPDVTAFASYDPRLVAAAAEHGLAVVTPGLAERWWDPLA
jgi:predicted nucleic acid-binding protein